MRCSLPERSGHQSWPHRVDSVTLRGLKSFFSCVAEVSLFCTRPCPQRTGKRARSRGRGDAGPKQALRQREYEDEDRSRARPQSDDDDRREPAPPTAWPGQFLRLRSMRMAPGQQALLFVMLMRVRMRVIFRVMCLLVGWERWRQRAR
jgi:hypothetical protein